MKHIKTTTVSRTLEEIESITCDICGTTHKGYSWADNSFDVLDTEISITSGVAFFDGDKETKKVSFDLCPSCFRDTLIPFIMGFGKAEATLTEN